MGERRCAGAHLRPLGQQGLRERAVHERHWMARHRFSGGVYFYTILLPNGEEYTGTVNLFRQN